MWAKTEIGEAVDQPGITESQAEDAALRTVKAGTGNGDPRVKTVGEMAEQGYARAADIG